MRILYVYLFRNIIKKSNCQIISCEDYKKALNSIIQSKKVPAIVYWQIANEMIDMGLLNRVDKRTYKITITNSAKKELSRLRDYIFPLTP
jgi:hypothetical protein